MSAPKKPIAKPKADATTGELAAYWAVKPDVILRMLELEPPAPLTDTDAMIDWFAGLKAGAQRMTSPGLRRKIGELRSEKMGEGDALPGLSGDYDKFRAQYDPVAARDVNALEEMKRQRDYCLFKVDLAQKRNDFASVQDATKQLTHFSAVIHDEESRAAKLGRELGDLIPRADAARVGRALGYWLLISCDEVIDRLARRISVASAGGAMAPETLRQMIEPELISLRVLEPLVRAIQVNAGTHLPQWFVDSVRSGLSDTIEDADKLAAELYAGSNATEPAKRTA